MLLSNMFKNIDSFFLDRLFQTYTNERIKLLPGSSPFKMAEFFFTGSMVMMLGAIGYLLTQADASWLEMFFLVIPVAPTLVFIKSAQLIQERDVTTLVSPNHLRETLLTTRLVTLAVLIAMMVFMNNRLLDEYLYKTGLWLFWLGLNFFSCVLPANTAEPPAPPTGNPWV